MVLLRGQLARDRTGTTEAHSAAFRSVANNMNCVISSRAVGIYATGLLEEGYATKGFHNKAKSCNWGPMAGFVLSDPRFTKRGGSRQARESQTKDIFKALKHGATEYPVYITDDRRRALQTAPLNCMRPAVSIDRDNLYYYATSPDSKLFLFHLQRKLGVPGAGADPMWQVQYALSERALSPGIERNQAQNLEFQPVMALVDVDCPPHIRNTFRSATTGDYDLFCVFPRRNNFDNRVLDNRMVHRSNRFKQPMSKFSEQESSEVGNITPRVMAVANQVNRAANHIGGPIVHHSDEAGRPMVSDMDFPIIAWVPGVNQEYCITTTQEFKEFIGTLRFDYQLMLNPGWFNQLGFGVSVRGSYEI